MPLSHLPHSTPHSLFAPPILDVMCELYILRTSLSCVLQVDCIRRVQKLANEKASDQEIAAHPSLRGLKLSAAQVSIMRSPTSSFLTPLPILFACVEGSLTFNWLIIFITSVTLLGLAYR